MKRKPTPAASQHGVPSELRSLLGAMFKEHELQSHRTINEIKSEIVALIHEADKQAQERHNQTLGVLAAHGSRLDLHELRLNRVEDRTSEVIDDRKAAAGDLKRALFAVVGSIFVAFLGASFSWLLLRATK